MAGAERHLHSVDADTGEVLDDCPSCKEKDRTYGVLERKYHGALSQIGQLEADQAKKARASELWPKALIVFRYWQLKTGHDKAEFTVDRFQAIERFLKPTKTEDLDERLEKCRRAIDGCVGDDWRMKRGPHANRRGQVHDKISQIFGTQDDFDGFVAETPDTRMTTIRAQTLRDVAGEVAARVLERAEAIDENDIVSCGHMLIEIDRLIREWRFIPETKTVDGVKWERPSSVPDTCDTSDDG